MNNYGFGGSKTRQMATYIATRDGRGYRVRNAYSGHAASGRIMDRARADRLAAKLTSEAHRRAGLETR